MKTITYSRYGGPTVAGPAKVSKSVLGAREILVRIRATTVCSGDWRARSPEMPPGFWLFGRPGAGRARGDGL
jgi:NADPH:quinone reductase-like Zn-dependent oxidoreductase